MRITAILTLLVPILFTAGCTAAQETASLDEKIGQMLLAGFRGLEIEEGNHIMRDIRDYHLGGVVLFDYDVPAQSPVRNIESYSQVQDLVASLQEEGGVPLFISIDQEGGRVARLKPRHGFPPAVSAQYLGTLNNADSTEFYASRTAGLLSELGINMNFAPVADLNTNAENPIIGALERSFSPDPDIVTKHARIFVEVHKQYGVFPVLKHFPGHGSSEDDSHLGMADVTHTWEPAELIPYRRLIEDPGIEFIMTAHIFNTRLDSLYPATLCRAVISGILRDSLGFGGVVVSDDMQMGAIRSEYGLETAIKQALLAGVDILAFANNSIYDAEIVPKAHRIIRELVERGEIGRDRIDESYRRIMEVKKRFFPELNEHR